MDIGEGGGKGMKEWETLGGKFGQWDRGWDKTLLDQRVFRIVLKDQE